MQRYRSFLQTHKAGAIIATCASIRDSDYCCCCFAATLCKNQDEFGIDGSFGESNLGMSLLPSSSHYASHAAAVSEPAVVHSQQRTSSATTASDKHSGDSDGGEHTAVPTDNSSIRHTASSDDTTAGTGAVHAIR
jgi:hypothetical protein